MNPDSYISWRRDQGQAIPAGLAEIVLADIEDAAACADGDRLALIWQQTPAMVGELLEHHFERGSLPI